MINPNDNSYPSFCGREAGSSKREELIKAAFTGLCANYFWALNSHTDIANESIKRADALIRALNNTE